MKLRHMIVLLILLSGCVEKESTGPDETTPEYPPIPNLLTPANNATNIYNFGNLTWSPQDSSNTFDVYLGTESTPPLISSDQSVNSYHFTNLLKETKYYWKVVSRNADGLTTSSPIWSFTTYDGILLNESFEQGLPSGWSTGSEGGGASWSQLVGQGYTGNACMQGIVEFFATFTAFGTAYLYTPWFEHDPADTSTLDFQFYLRRAPTGTSAILYAYLQDGEDHEIPLLSIGPTFTWAPASCVINRADLVNQQFRIKFKINAGCGAGGGAINSRVLLDDVSLVEN